jgi:hypothetical protein
MQEAQGDPYAIRFGVSPVFNAPQVSVQLITTVNGYYAPSTFRCVKVKAVNVSVMGVPQFLILDAELAKGS